MRTMRTTRLAVLGLCVAACAACGKSADKPATKGATGAASAVGLPGAATATAADLQAAKARVLKAAFAVRCQLTGYAPPDDKVYAAHGFADAAAFGHALDEAAKADPKWAETALANLYSQSCPGQRAGAPAPAATPTASEAAP